MNGLVSAVLLRRAHLVLAYIMHFYIQSLPPTAAVLIPRSVSLPILRVSSHLDIPPLLTFSDTVLYNWTTNYNRIPTSSTSSSQKSSTISAPASHISAPSIMSLRTKTMFSSLLDEEEFYRCSARIELRGVEALEIMRATMDEIFIGDTTAVRRITGYLHTLAYVIGELKVLLMDVRRGCHPDRYYNLVRPWFRGEDSDVQKRKWVFEGLEEAKLEGMPEPKELSGPSAGQSSLVHVLDIFLGVDHERPGEVSFMKRMQKYMPRNHRLFLDHLGANSRPLRGFVTAVRDTGLEEAYNAALVALKEFRDGHMIVATLYILGPARRAAQTTGEEKQLESVFHAEPLKGTGGTDLVRFLKDTRNRTHETIIP
jgi:indoleamine 2,3-dioxygenase